MNTDLIVAILSLAAAVVSVVLPRLWPPPRSDSTGSLPPSADASGRAFLARARRLIWTRRTAAFLAGVAFAAVLLGSYLLVRSFQSEALAAARITNPADGEHVGVSVEVAGTAAHLRSEQKVWILTQSYGAPQFYPQPGPAAISGAGQWSTRAYFGYGGAASAGRQFDILAVLAMPSAGHELAAYFERREADAGAARFFALPEGAQIADKIRVFADHSGPGRRCGHPVVHTASIRGTVTISTIRQGAKVGRSVDPLEGTYRNLAPGSSIWIFVYSNVARRFYPQTPGPVAAGKGRYRGAALFGGEAGEHYEVVVVLATRTASRSLARTVATWSRKKDYPGLMPSEFPRGLHEKACVAVWLGG